MKRNREREREKERRIEACLELGGARGYRGVFWACIAGSSGVLVNVGKMKFTAHVCIEGGVEESSRQQRREHTIGAVRYRNLPARSLQVPESCESFLWHRFKVRSIVTGLHQDDERDDDRSHRRFNIMSSLDTSWFRLITNILIQSRDLAWLRGGTSVAPWRHKCSHVPVFPSFVWPSFRPNFDLGPSPSDSTEIISELMILESRFSFNPLNFCCSFCG